MSGVKILNITKTRYFKFLVIPALAAIDQLLKTLVVSGLSLDTAFLKIDPHYNSGILGGFLSQLDPWISRIFFSVLFAFILLFTVVVLQLLSPKKTPRLKMGLLLYMAGILGNVWDRAVSGQIVDFIILPFWPLSEFAFNFADLVLAVGFVLIAIALVKEFDQIWVKNNLRKNYLIDPVFQWSLTRYFLGIAFANFFVISAYSFSFIRIYLQPDFELSPEGSAMIIKSFIVGMTVLEFCFLLALLGFGIYYSHRIAGPIYIFQKRMRSALGYSVDESVDVIEENALKLRSMDYFKTLQDLSADLERQLKSRRKAEP